MKKLFKIRSNTRLQIFLGATLLLIPGMQTSASKEDLSSSTKMIAQTAPNVLETNSYLLNSDPNHSFKMSFIKPNNRFKDGIMKGTEISSASAIIGPDLSPLILEMQPFNNPKQNDPVISNSVNGYLEEYYGPPLPVPPSPPVSEYIVTASNLTDDLIISASTSYSWPDSWGNIIVSLSPTEGFADQITIPSINGDISATIYVKTGVQFTPGDCYGTITQTSTGAPTDIIDVYIASYLYVYSPVTYIGHALQCPGSIINLPLTTEGFNHVGGFQYNIEYDPTVLSFLSLENLNPALPCIYEDCEDPAPSRYIISSVTNINPSLSRLNIALVDEIDGSWSVTDGDKLFDLSFYYTGGFSGLVFNDVSYYYSETGGVPYTVIDEPQSFYYHNGSVGPANNTSTITITPDALSFGDVLVGTHSAVQTYTITACGLTAPVTVTAPAGSAIQNIDGNWVQSIDLPHTEGNLDATVTVCFKPYSASVYSGNISNESAGANGQNVTVTGTGIENNNPYIIIEPEALDILYTDFSNPCSSSQIYRINGCNLTENLNLSNVDMMAEFSLTGENDFTSALAIIPVNGVVDTSVYIRLCPFDHFNLVAIINNSSSGVSESLIAKIVTVTGNAPVTDIGQVTAAPGAMVYVPVTVTDFIDIWSAQYIIEFDPTVLSFQYLDNIFFDIWPHEVSVTQIDSTHSQLEIIIVCGLDWAMTTPDNEKLFDLVFAYSTGYSSLDFGDCFHTHFWTGILNDEPHSLYYHNGSVGPVKKRIQFDVALEGLYNPSKGDMNQAFGRDFPDAIADEITIGLARSTFPYSILFEIESVLLERRGYCEAEIPDNFNGEYYIVIKHRNSIETWSKMPVTFNQDTVCYNFTDIISRAYKNNLILLGEKYYIYAGDVNQDGIIDTGDMTPVDNDASAFVTGYVATDVNGDGNVDTGDMTYVDNNSASYIIAERPLSSNPIVLTSDITNITYSTAMSGGEVIEQGSSPISAYGVCWSTIQNPTTADNYTSDGTGTGIFTSNLTGLTGNTVYYVRAYAVNNAGIAYGNELSFITGNCGLPLTITHWAGSVAPVDKVVTYGTVTNIPGETSKCWITSNLGADYQATSVDDPSEASAGWYWQFNRMQGYKHDGSNVTPTWTITAINENSDWLAANDPCSLELGSGWRIPSYSEWYNVDNIGNWTTWSGPWNSDLKLHAAGNLFANNGLLYNRGIYGIYWSSTTPSTTTGWIMAFHQSGICNISSGFKADGFSLRCLKD